MPPSTPKRQPRTNAQHCGGTKTNQHILKADRREEARHPLWQLLPSITFWFLPAVVGLPVIALSLRRYART